MGGSNKKRENKKTAAKQAELNRAFLEKDVPTKEAKAAFKHKAFCLTDFEINR